MEKPYINAALKIVLHALLGILIFNVMYVNLMLILLTKITNAKYVMIKNIANYVIVILNALYVNKVL